MAWINCKSRYQSATISIAVQNYSSFYKYSALQ